MRGKTYIIALLVFSLGALMLLGSSYSLIIGNLVSEETYGFDVANFDVQFSDNKEISISGVPETDEEGLKESDEYSFTVINNSDYDVNYRLDIIEKNSFKMGNVVHYAYTMNNSEYSKVLSLDDNFTIKQNKVLKKGEKDNYKIKIWLSIDADESYMNKTFNANISLVATQNEYKYATTVIEKLAKTNKDGIVSSNNDYRFTKDTNNYIWFNCQEGFTKGDDYCEKWQIIGSFLNRKENAIDEYYMLKIMNNKKVEEISFNNQDKLGDYDNSYIETFANGSYYDKLNDMAKKYIMMAKWNIGSTDATNYEKSLKEEKTKEYYGNIGLLNTSDYLFLKDNSFISKDNIMLLNKNGSSITVINDNIINGDSTKMYSFLPCVYLRPDVSIISGDGTISNPYEITIKYPMNY